MYRMAVKQYMVRYYAHEPVTNGGSVSANVLAVFQYY